MLLGTYLTLSVSDFHGSVYQMNFPSALYLDFLHLEPASVTSVEADTDSRKKQYISG